MTKDLELLFDNLIAALAIEFKKQFIQELNGRQSTTLNAVKQYYSLNEVVEITGLSVLALKGRRKRGSIKLVNEGNCILMAKAELDRLLSKLNKA